MLLFCLYSEVKIKGISKTFCKQFSRDYVMTKIGRSQLRFEDDRFLRGQGQYTDDIKQFDKYSVFCEEEICMLNDGLLPLIWDSGHLSLLGIERLAAAIRKQNFLGFISEKHMLKVRTKLSATSTKMLFLNNQQPKMNELK